jgi:hypothetical protein
VFKSLRARRLWKEKLVKDVLRRLDDDGYEHQCFGYRRLVDLFDFSGEIGDALLGI